MAVFEYIAKDSTGNILSGSYTDVESIHQLRQEMKKLGYSLVKAHSEKQFFGKKVRIKSFNRGTKTLATKITSAMGQLPVAMK